ncbi:hypothetical protein VNO77_27439 [Canavalia gladiata]|uniref:Uncharacterized protein n=1 Tax=Canavalia gladiata TaxID=3824 RepID=A0AAN9KUP5_CANGL
MASLKCYRSYEETCESKYNNNRNTFDHMAGMSFKGNQHYEQQHAKNHGQNHYDQTTMNKNHSQTMVKTQCTDQCVSQSHGHDMAHHHHSSHGNGSMGWHGKSEKNCQQSNSHGYMAMGHRHSSHGNGGMACSERKMKTRSHGYKRRDGNRSCSDDSSGSESD